jgi:SAM-dependent methyltransferase
MTFTGERFTPQLHGQIAYEHIHRYSVAADFARGCDVLDIACGEGYGSSLLAAVARSVVGVDIDPASVRHAAARYPAMNLTFRTGPATAIPLDDASVDVVVSFETIEHLAEQREMMTEFVRVLRPGGRLVISSPNKLVYSDARGITNAFHVDEFRSLLEEFFPKIRTFGQRIFGASGIHPLHGATEHTAWLGPAAHKTPGIIALPDAEYFIAVCARNAEDDLPDVSSVYVDTADDLLDDIRSGGLAAPTGEPDASRISMLERERGEAEARIAQLERERATLQERLGDVERRLRRKTVIAQEAAVELLRIRGENEHYRRRCAAQDEHIAALGATLHRDRALIASLCEAHECSVRSIEAAEAAAEAYRCAIDAVQLDRFLLADALGARELRLAAVETRRIQAPPSRYSRLLARLRNGKAGRLRMRLRRLAGRAAAVNARVARRMPGRVAN